MKISNFLFSFFLLILGLSTQAQVGIGTNTPAASAQLEVSSTTKGFLPPRMLASERAAIGSPVAGLMVYQTDGTKGLYYYDGSSWIFIIPTNITGNAATATNLTGLTTSVATLNNVSGSNTGDETAASIKIKLGVTTLSGSNTGDQTTITGNAGSATNLAAGAAGSLPYQSAANSTTFLAKGTDGQILTLASGVPSWTTVSGGSSQWTSTSSNIYYSTGNVGIGTTNPTAKLFVKGGTRNDMIRVESSDNPSISFKNTDLSGGSANDGEYQFFATGNPANPSIAPGSFGLYYDHPTAAGYRFSVSKEGNVGIGTGKPTTKLDVNGDIKTNGTITVGTVTYPNAHNSTAGQVLTINAAGGASWATASSGAAAAGTITGTTLAANVVNSSLTSVGTLTSATISGKAIIGATSAASASAVLEASSTTQGFLPPRMTAAQRNLINTPAQGLMVYCTNCGTNGEPEYYNGAGWVNLAGGATATATSGSTTPTTPPTTVSIGSSYQGGTVAYILVSGDTGYDAAVQHGLIVANVDQNSGAGIPWCNYGVTTTTNATGTAIGTGFANTNLIIASQGAGTNYAAAAARNYQGGGYTDWYLPSKDELNKLFLNRVAIGSLNLTVGYHTSTEGGATTAWGQYFGNGITGNNPKCVGGGGFPGDNVRAIRSF